jgi:hypothetical protein
MGNTTLRTGRYVIQILITFCQHSNNTDYFHLLKETTFQLINNHQDAFDSFRLMIIIR